MANAPVNPDVEQLDDPEAGSTWFISLASMVLLTGTVIALAVLFFGAQSREVAAKSKTSESEVLRIDEIRMQQKALLADYASYRQIPIGGTEQEGVDRLRIPIERAMEMLVAEANSGASAASPRDALASDSGEDTR